MAGQGWRMLMECLAAGRAISLPSSATAGAKSMLRVSSAYAPHPQAVRPADRAHGRHRGAAGAHGRDRPTSTRRRAPSPPPWSSRGERPSVISALMKYQTTERMRRAVNDAIDIHGGRAICDGPVELSAVGLSDGSGRHHGRRRQHPDAHADHVRPGRAALASLSLSSEIQAAPGPRRDARPRRLRQRLRRPRRLLGAERLRRLLPQRHRRLCSRRRRRKPSTRRTGTASSARCSRNFAFVADLTVAVARRRPEDQAEAHRPARRRAVGTLSPRLRAEALRGRRQACRATAPSSTLRRHERPLPLPGGAARRRRQFPRRAGALG